MAELAKNEGSIVLGCPIKGCKTTTGRHWRWGTNVSCKKHRVKLVWIYLNTRRILSEEEAKLLDQ